MARKSFHHLAEGDGVVLEHYQWGEDGDMTILEETPGEVLEVRSRQLVIKFQMRVWVPDLPWSSQATFWTHQSFSKRTGLRWGAEEDDYQIHPNHKR